MSNKSEGAISTVAAIFVLFVALMEPLVSAGLAVVFLIVLSVYKFTRKE